MASFKFGEKVVTLSIFRFHKLQVDSKISKNVLSNLAVIVSPPNSELRGDNFGEGEKFWKCKSENWKFVNSQICPDKIMNGGVNLKTWKLETWNLELENLKTENLKTWKLKTWGTLYIFKISIDTSPILAQKFLQEHNFVKRCFRNLGGQCW